MPTESQILANRRNAQKSTGPRSIEGKAAVSRNAVRHGLLARRDVISCESQAEFDNYRRQILDELSPVSQMESVLAERIVTLSWRLKRVGRFQNQTIDTLHADNSNPSPLKKLSQSLLLKYQPQPVPSDSTENLPLGRLAVEDFGSDHVLERLLMYERRLENSLYKTLLEFQRLRLTRQFKSQSAI